MKRKHRVWECVGLRLAGLTLCVAAVGSSATAGGQTANAVEVVVTVTVTDASGRAITGLAPAMFRAEVDGVPVEPESLASSHELTAAIVFAPGIVERWGEIREGVAEAIRESGGSSTTVFSRDEPIPESGSAVGVRFSGSKDRYRWSGDELAGMIALGLDSLQSLADAPGLRRAVFVVLEFPPEDLRHYRKSLLEQAASDNVQVFALWRSRRRYAEDEGRSMLLLEELVERTGGRAAQFRDPDRIPGIVAQFASALRAAYELRLTVPSRRDESRIDVDVSLPKEDPRIQVSFRTRARTGSE